MKHTKIIFLISTILFFFTYLTITYSQTENILLWNKLGNNTEAVNSEYGPNGIIYGTMNYYDAQFAKGTQPSRGWSGHYIEFDATIIDPEKGCIEFWYNNFSPPKTGHEFHGLINSPYDGSKDKNLGISNNAGAFDITFRFSKSPWIAISESEIPLGLFHIAVVWDRNGINSSSDYIRYYLNSTLVATQTTYNNWGTTSTGIFKVAVNRGWLWPNIAQCFAVDNLKIWNYAKTDFSDRFLEALNVESAFEDLDDTVVELELPQGTENSLTSKLDNALKSLEKDNDGAAINQLEAFINHVEAKRSKEITEEDADYLIATTESIINEIEVTLEKRADNSIVKTDNIKPTKYSLAQNYPNPFNPTTTIGYALPEDVHVILSIYDVLGNEVAQLENGYKSAGHYSNSFNASDLTSGIYFYRIRTSKFVDFKKMLLIK